MTQIEPSREEVQEIQAKCQLILRIATGIILAAFVLIIALTTASTGELVRSAGKMLYYLIVFSILVSLVTWLYRERLGKKLGSDETLSK